MMRSRCVDVRMTVATELHSYTVDTNKGNKTIECVNKAFLSAVL